MRLALSWSGGQMSYVELDERVDRAARWLRSRGVRRESLVALRLSGPDMVVAMLAVWRAGGAFLPLDPQMNQARQELILADARPLLVVDELESGTQACVWEQARPEDLAYVIYTSGSTGRPKGVAVTHAGIPVILAAARQIMRLGPEDCLLQSASPSFDAYVINVIIAVDARARLYLPGEHFAAELAGVIRENGVTVVNVPPSALTTLPEDEPLGRLRQIMVAGEVCPPGLAARWSRRYRLLNQYGPTEATIWSTVYEASPQDAPLRTLPIGKPIPGVAAYVLDAGLRQVAPGETGQLCLSGAVLARGYLGRPELTATAFVTGPQGERVYRTGDLARWLPSGDLEFLGRIDHQVKLRGFRVELGEVETALTWHPRVREAVVVMRGEGASARLVGYVVARQAVSAAELREHCARTLPDYMVPAEVVLLDDLPRTLSGKVDRAALPEARTSAGDSGDIVAQVWERVLGRAPGADDDFFAIGGHSLAAAQVVTTLRRELGVSLGVRELFDHPRLSDFARIVHRPQGTEEIARAATGAAPLSLAQERRWLAERLGETARLRDGAWALRIRGEWDQTGWEQAITELHRRHDVLRTWFDSSGEEVRAVARPPEPVRLPTVDLSGQTDPLAAAYQWARSTTRSGYPDPGPTVHWQLARLADDDHLLVLGLHHIVADRESQARLLDELLRLRQGEPVPEPRVHYADYAIWQRERAGTPNWQRQLGYWRKTLAHVPAALDLPFDREPGTTSGWEGGIAVQELPDKLMLRVDELAETRGIASFNVLLSAFVLLLRERCGQDPVVAVPVSGRTRPELESVLGHFENRVAVWPRLELAQDSAVDLVSRTLAQARAHGEVPFELVVEQSTVDPVPGRPPLAQVMFGVREPGPAPVAIDLTERLSEMDLKLTLVDRADGWVGEWEFRTDLFELETVLALQYGYQLMLEGLVG